VDILKVESERRWEESREQNKASVFRSRNAMAIMVPGGFDLSPGTVECNVE